MNTSKLKNNRRRLFVLISSIILVLSGCSISKSSQQQNSVDWTEHYNTVVEMIINSNYIILARVTNQSYEVRQDLVFTLSEVSVVKNIGLSLITESQKFTVLQTGGISNGIETAPIEDVLMLKSNNTYLLFLRETDENNVIIMGGFQGIASIINGKVLFPDNHSFSKNQLDQIFVSDLENTVSSILMDH
jgi:hypothetical protein